MLIENLIQMGFSDREAKVYAMLLRTGPSQVGSLARRVKMNRTVVYAALNALCGRGLVNFEQLSKGRRYLPYDPECLLYDLEGQKAELRFRKELAERCIEEIREIDSRPDDERNILFSCGLSVVRDTLLKKLSKQKPIFCVFNKDSALKELLKGFPRQLLNKLNAPLSGGELLLQDSHLFFFYKKKNEIHMLNIKDPVFVESIRTISFDVLSCA